jgi:hypothetical protein
MGASNVKIPLSCYDLLKFPKREGSKLTKMPDPAHIKYFNALFDKKVTITSTVYCRSPEKDKLLHVPHTLEKELNSKKSQFTITPIVVKSNTEIYGLFQDTKHDIWIMFKTPGSTKSDKVRQIEQRIIDLLEKKFKKDIDLFYVNIDFEPPEDSDDHLWWPAFIVYLYMAYNKGVERETLVNDAQAKVLMNDPLYTKFKGGFYDYIEKNI